MHLERWPAEPEAYQLVALFRGEQSEIQGFLQVWLCWGGHLDLQAVEVKAAQLPRDPGEDPPPRAYVVAVGRTPSYYMVNWWLERPQSWRLFYRPLQTNGDGQPPARSALPSGVYSPWGYQVEPAPPDEAALVVAWEHGGRVICLRLPGEKANYKNLFEMFEQGPSTFALPEQPPLLGTSHEGSGGVGVARSLSVRLESAQRHRAPTNPGAELTRLRKRIAELKEQEAMLEWQASEREIAAELAVYRETQDELLEDGTDWDLRNWFLTTPSDAIREFLHARVVVNSLGPLHLVYPADLYRPPTAALPRPAYRLRLDRHWWHRQGRKVFLPPNTELLPAPPVRNEHVARLLERALWEDRDPATTTLVMLKAGGEQSRFAVRDDEFQPLDRRIDQLNFAVALNWTLREPATDVMSMLLQQARAALAANLAGHAETMRTELDRLWDGESRSLELLRQQVAEAVLTATRVRGQIQQTERLRADVARVFERDWGSWSSFLERMHELDRELMPESRSRLSAWLKALDSTRARVSELWSARGEPQSPEAAAQLRKLADELDARRRAGGRGER